MTKQSYCRYCDMYFCKDIPEDVKKHQRNHERKILAERVFGHIAGYSEREYLKDKVHRNDRGKYVKEFCLGGEELLYYAHWCRSIEGCGYDLKHPTLQEYIVFRKIPDCEFLNGSYVNMKVYKEHLNK